MRNVLGETSAVAISFEVSNKPVFSSIPNHSLLGASWYFGYQVLLQVGGNIV
jgi:hypothetical protein